MQLLIPMETYRTCDFLGRGRENQTPCPPSRSAHGCNICGPAAAGDIPTVNKWLYGLCGPKDGI